jgi:hypothetical protein
MRSRHPVALAAVAAMLLAAGGCGTVDITGARLQDNVGSTYLNMYVLQQRLLGRADPPVPLDSSVANCAKGGFGGGGRVGRPDPTTPDRGAGDDWVCQVRWLGPNGLIDTLTYDVRVQPAGCYTAQGPASVVGQQNMRAADGRTVPNPLYEFDGCLDIG